LLKGDIGRARIISDVITTELCSSQARYRIRTCRN